MRCKKRCNSSQSVLLLISNSVERVKVRRKENKKVRWDQKLKLMPKRKLRNYRLILMIHALPLENKDLTAKLIAVPCDACLKQRKRIPAPPARLRPLCHYRKRSESSCRDSRVSCRLHGSPHINYLDI